MQRKYRYSTVVIYYVPITILILLLLLVSRSTDWSITAFKITPSKQPSIILFYSSSQQQQHLTRDKNQWRPTVRFAQVDREKSESGGQQKRIPVDKTYDNQSYKKDIIIDQEGAMLSFFNSREEWLPLFRSVAGTNLPKDTLSLLNDITSTSTSFTTSTPITLNDIDFSYTTSPWKRYDAIPSNEQDRTVVARFLDSMQDSLLAIPVMEVDVLSQMMRSNDQTQDNDDDEEEVDDENDIQFVEEGRRLLAINRFHVLPSSATMNNNNNNNNNDSSSSSSSSSSTSIHAIDELFRYCWSEIFVLSQEGTVNSGSIILLPNKEDEEQYELSSIRQFIDMNIIQPLQWLGIHEDYEITSFQRDSPVIRMIYKLNDIPKSSSYNEEDGFAAN